MHLSVKIENKQIISSEGLCDEVNIKFQRYQFLTSFYVLFLRGYDVVLGVKWLETLGPIT